MSVPHWERTVSHERQYAPGPSADCEQRRSHKRRRVPSNYFSSRPSVLACTQLLASLAPRGCGGGGGPSSSSYSSSLRERKRPLRDDDYQHHRQSVEPQVDQEVRARQAGPPSDHWAWLDEVLPPKHASSTSNQDNGPSSSSRTSSSSAAAAASFSSSVSSVVSSAHTSFISVRTSSTSAKRGQFHFGESNDGRHDVMGLMATSSWSSDSSTVDGSLEHSPSTSSVSSATSGHAPLAPPSHHHHRYYQPHHPASAASGESSANYHHQKAGSSETDLETDDSHEDADENNDDWGWYVENDADHPGTRR